MKKLSIAAFVLSLTCALAATGAEKNAPAAAGATPAARGPGVDKMIERESRQPMDMNEPMSTGMAKPGMKKGDVKSNAMKKESAMDEKMKKEKIKP
jgi:hypothetical protein